MRSFCIKLAFFLIAMFALCLGENIADAKCGGKAWRGGGLGLFKGGFLSRHHSRQGKLSQVLADHARFGIMKKFWQRQADRHTAAVTRIEGRRGIVSADVPEQAPPMQQGGW